MSCRGAISDFEFLLQETDFWSRILQGGPSSLDPIPLDNDLSFEPNDLSFDPIPLDNDLSFTENDLDDEFNLTDPPSVAPSMIQSELPSLRPSKHPSFEPSRQPTAVVLDADTPFSTQDDYCSKGGKGGKGTKSSASPGGKKASFAPGTCGKKSSSPGKAGGKASSKGKKATELPTPPGEVSTLDLEDDFVIEGGVQKDHHQSGSNDPPSTLEEEFEMEFSTKASKSPGKGSSKSPGKGIYKSPGKGASKSPGKGPYTSTGKGGKKSSASPSVSTQPSVSNDPSFSPASFNALDLEDDFTAQATVAQVGKGKASPSPIKRKTSKAPAGKAGKANRV